MTSRQQVNELCRRRLGDRRAPYTFTDLQINQWIHDAIAELSQFFPQTLRARFTLQSGQNPLDLSSLVGFQTILRVRYPLGVQPPRFLRRRLRTQAGFFGNPLAYDLDRDEGGVWQLYLGVTPQGGEQLELTYQADHLFPSADDSELTIPDRHLELIVLFVRMAALQEQLAQLGAQALPAPALLNVRMLNAARARQEYLQALAKARQMDCESLLVAW